MKLLSAVLFLAAVVTMRATDLDTIGITVLRQLDPTLTGSGVAVAQAEGTVSGTDPNVFEVNPSAVGQPTNLFTYISSIGTTMTYTNSVGSESWHADAVAANFYSVTNGPVPQASHVYNYEAVDFFNGIISPGNSIPARVVNQSFIYSSSDEALINTNYDYYAAQYGTIFVSGITGIGNAKPLCPPGTSYNGIGVGPYGAFYLPGPTADGRCKPDICAPDQAQAPNGAVSYATPYVSGAATILVQAAARGDGGANTSAAGDLRTIKALLLNGAFKPGDWTNGVTTPLDARYGAGLVNVLNSWKQLSGGKHAFIESTSNVGGAAHPPGGNAGNEPALVGWDLNSITNPNSGHEQVNHYYFDLTQSTGSAFTVTATLAWNRQLGQTAINDLNLFLYDTSNSNLVLCSTSAVDNVEHIYLPMLPAGRYDLQVQKNPTAQVSASETYALAFEIFNMNLNIALTDTNAVISWPVAPMGFRLLSKASLDPLVSWTAVGATVSVDTNNNQFSVSLPVGTGNQFFRLQRP